MLLPAPVGDASSMVAQALTLYKNLVVDKPGKKAFHETTMPAGSTRQIGDEDGAISSPGGKPVFSLQSPKVEE